MVWPKATRSRVARADVEENGRTTRAVCARPTITRQWIAVPVPKDSRTTQPALVFAPTSWIVEGTLRRSLALSRTASALAATHGPLHPIAPTALHSTTLPTIVITAMWATTVSTRTAVRFAPLQGTATATQLKSQGRQTLAVIVRAGMSGPARRAVPCVTPVLLGTIKAQTVARARLALSTTQSAHDVAVSWRIATVTQTLSPALHPTVRVSAATNGKALLAINVRRTTARPMTAVRAVEGMKTIPIATSRAPLLLTVVGRQPPLQGTMSLVACVSAVMHGAVSTAASAQRTRMPPMIVPRAYLDSMAIHDAVDSAMSKTIAVVGQRLCKG